ncbi:hypothetical protein N7475_006382 [Penicillium sp. IBT 31633x]|nr:hypothetical protein N7475_006382 [Penicillium sp. IBT 31633x]
MSLQIGRTGMVITFSANFNLGIWKMQLISLQGAIWSENRQETGCGGAPKPTREGPSISLRKISLREDELEVGVDSITVIIERQISYFADEDRLNGFLKHLGDNPRVRIFEVTRYASNQETPHEQFALWSGVGDVFNSLVCAMTRFDPGERITARQALEHKRLEIV